MPNWTDETTVKARLNSRTPMSSQDIQDIIDQVEDTIAIELDIPKDDFTYDATKYGHKLLRRYATVSAAKAVLFADTASIRSIREATLILDGLNDEEGDLKQAFNQKNVNLYERLE